MEFDVAALSYIGSREYNQDVVWTERELFGKANHLAVAVFDGHGKHGHKIAAVVKGARTFILIFFFSQVCWFFLPPPLFPVPAQTN